MVHHANWNFIPLSKLSSLLIEGSPISKIGSSTGTVVLFTVVVVPFTVKVPETTASPVIVTVDDVISSELSVPVTVKSPPTVTSSGKPICIWVICDCGFYLVRCTCKS